MEREVTEGYLEWLMRCTSHGYVESVRTLTIVGMGAFESLEANLALDKDGELRGMVWSDGDTVYDEHRGYVDIDEKVGTHVALSTIGSHCECWDFGAACCYCGSEDDVGVFGSCKAARTVQCKGVSRE